MTNQSDNHDKGNTNTRLTKLEIIMEEIVVPDLKEIKGYINENRRGISFASLFDSKATTFIIMAVIAAASFYLSRGGDL